MGHLSAKIKDYNRRAASRIFANRAFYGRCETSVRLVASSRPRSVLLLLVESLSRVNARVQLPRTVAVLRDLYNSTFLNGETLIEVITNTLELSTALRESLAY